MTDCSNPYGVAERIENDQNHEQEVEGELPRRRHTRAGGSAASGNLGLTDIYRISDLASRCARPNPASPRASST